MRIRTFRDLNYNNAKAVVESHVAKYAEFANLDFTASLLLTCGSVLVVLKDGTVTFRPDHFCNASVVIFCTTPLYASDTFNITIIKKLKK